MPPTLPTPSEAQPSSPPGAATPVARAVADDLAAIFPDPPPGATSPRPKRGLRRDRGDDKRRPRERRAAAVGAIACAALLGVSAGALIARSPQSAKSAPPPAAARLPIHTISAPALPEPGPLAPGPLHAPAPPPVKTLAVEAPTPELRRAVESRSAAAKPRARRVSSRKGGSVMAADARLRRAYSAAVRAGVSRGVLADYRDEWGRLRHRAPRQPKLVAARYNDMASNLERLASRRRVAHAAPRRSNPFRTLRTEFAALWR